MALCQKCLEAVKLCGGPDGKKCSSCGKVLDNPENKVCEECSDMEVLCEYCGQEIERMRYEVIAWDALTAKHVVFSFESENDETAKEYFNEHFVYKNKGWTRFELMRIIRDGTRVHVAFDCV